MARRRPTRHGSVPGMVRFEEPKAAVLATSGDGALFQLGARVAEQTLDDAMVELAQAEQRLYQLSREKSAPRHTPTWFVATQERETAAGDALETLYRQIAPPNTKAGLAIKLQLAALLYSENPEADENEEDVDMVSPLLRSVISDVTER
jgi:hypothetical protein